jgi:hypothetical protein
LITDAGTEAVKNFIFILFFSIVGSSLFYWVGLALGNATGLAVANGVFFLLLVAYEASQLRAMPLKVVIAASISITVFLAVCAFVGTMVYNNWPRLGHLLTAAVSVGYYPSGADVPILPGLLIWGASLTALTFVGLISGSLLHRLTPNRRTRRERGLELEESDAGL